MGKTLPIKDVGTIEQIKQLYIRKGNHRDLLLFLLGINTGANLVDLLSLDVKDVKDKHYLVFKNKCSLPINEEIQELIKLVIADRKVEEPLFATSRGSRLDRTRAFYSFKEICQELALGEDISVASFRKTFGYFHYQKYNDLSFLQWLFNQCTVEATMDFIDVRENMSLRFQGGVCL